MQVVIGGELQSIILLWSFSKFFYWVKFSSDVCCRLGFKRLLSAASGVARHDDSRASFEFVILLKLGDKAE